MFSPAKSDLLNDETDTTAFAQLTNVIPLHSSSTDASPDVSPDSTRITVSDFCQLHNINSDQFLALRRKAARRHPALDFKPIREGSRTFWVQNTAILTQMIDEGAIELENRAAKRDCKNKTEKVDAELVEETDLPNSTKLSIVKRFASIDLALPERQNIVYETTDYSQIDALLGQLQADKEAREQVKEVLHLKKFSDDLIARRKKEQLVEMLIEQGYTQEQAIKIATGMNK